MVLFGELRLEITNNDPAYYVIIQVKNIVLAKNFFFLIKRAK